MFTAFLLHLLITLMLVDSLLCSNPDQSKHLETARMRIFDTWIDFVNLRSETYVENSRIPDMVNSTPVIFHYVRLLFASFFGNIFSALSLKSKTFCVWLDHFQCEC